MTEADNNAEQSFMYVLKITLKRLVLFFTICVFVLIPFSIYSIQNTNKYQSALFFLVMLTLAIAGFLIFNKRLVLFEPIVLFSFYYITVVISGFSLISTDFTTNVYVQNTSFRNEITTLTTYACMYFFFGYICTLLGYYLVKTRNLKIEFILEPNNRISDTVINIFVIAFLIIGISNFIYNVWVHAGGSLFQYMANLSMREYEFMASGTTLGYMFADTAMYVWFFKLARKNMFWSKLFLIFLIITITMKASTGRVFATMAYAASFIGIYYFIELGGKRITNNAIYYIAAIGLAVFGIVVYLLRIISGMAANNLLTGSVYEQFEELLGAIGFIAVDLGYIPNTGVFLKIIDSWNSDIGYLYGQSLISWIFNALPSSIKPINYQPSAMIKQTWYADLPVGNLPPTGIGEMYANFGMAGPFIGMFLFGCLSAFLYNFAMKSKSYWTLAIFIQITIGFIMLYPKGELDNLSLLTVLPIMMSVIALKMISYASSNSTC